MLQTNGPLNSSLKSVIELGFLIRWMDALGHKPSHNTFNNIGCLCIERQL